MKKGLLIAMLVAFLAAISIAKISFVSADDMKGGGMMGGDMMKGDMMGKGAMMGGKMMGMCGMMHPTPTIVATSDGGIVVLTGNKLTKYDKNLNVVKEAELKTPEMSEMKKMCPMMGHDMGQGMADDDNTKAEQAEHESHHPENK
jgi:hypothetical protein